MNYVLQMSNFTMGTILQNHFCKIRAYGDVAFSNSSCIYENDK